MSHSRDSESTLAWSRSLRASQARRVTAARMRRWSLRRRITATTMVVAALGFGGVAAAQTTSGGGSAGAATTQTQSNASVQAVQAKLGVPADGVVGPQTRKALRSYQRSASIGVDGIIGPETLGAMGLKVGQASDRSVSAKSGAVGGSSASPTLQKIAQCESGGDPTAVSSNGMYRGKYQFDRQTWAANGGSGDPAAASEATQDRMAAKLLAARGTSPWPVCGR